MTGKFDPKARANEIAAQVKAAEEEQKAYDDTIAEALKSAGRTRVEFVERLYEHFDIPREMTERRDKDGAAVRGKDGQPVKVRTDKNEEARIQKLAAAFERLVEKTSASPAQSPHEAKPAADPAAQGKSAGPPQPAPTQRAS